MKFVQLKQQLVWIIIPCLVACQSASSIQTSLIAKPAQSGYMSSIDANGSTVMVKLADGQKRALNATIPSYSATIGTANVQGQNNQLTINASVPTVSAAGIVTGSGLFKPNAPEGAHWQLIKLNGQAIEVKGSPRPPYLRLSANKMHGLTGCNVMSGFYNRNHKHDMQFIQVQGSTQTCPTYQRLESDFIAALQQLRVWHITPEYHLQFVDDKQHVVAEFVALSP